MRAVILSGGKRPSKELLLKQLKKDDFIIGVDKGCETLYDLGIIPNIIVGDFDSSKKEVIDYFKSKNVKCIELDVSKDYTDTHCAYNIIKERNDISDILILGATGTRYDHALGNIGLLFNGMKDGINITIIDDNNKMYLTDCKTVIKREKGKKLSFHALSDVVKGFTIKGALYKLENYDMTLLEPRAISNEFLDDTDVTIDFESGIILIMITND